MTALPKKVTFEQGVFGLLGDMHWKSTLIDYDDYGNEVFLGKHTKINASHGDTEWYIWRKVFNIGGDVYFIEGPLQGAWNDRENLAWDYSSVSYSPDKDETVELKELLGEILNQLRITNLYLSEAIGAEITQEDLN